MTLSGLFGWQLLIFISVFTRIIMIIADDDGHPNRWKAFGASRNLFRAGFKRQQLENDILASPVRLKRVQEHLIEECMYMKSEEGDYYYKATTNPDGTACGIYIYGEPNEKVQIQFHYLDVSCENGGLVVTVDGWELNGKLFPSPNDHQKDVNSRFNQYCGEMKHLKHTFVSSQNVALIQHRMPSIGASFRFSVRFIKNPIPCNVLIQLGETYTLRNYDRRSNCSIAALFPAAVKILGLNVGFTPSRERHVEFETGIFHKCHKRGLEDFVQIGGSSDLDNHNMQIADGLCGISSKPARYPENIGCEVTTVRLISSGDFDNSVTVSLFNLSENDINKFLSVRCVPDDEDIGDK